jgi:hypothetical protein
MNLFELPVLSAVRRGMAFRVCVTGERRVWLDGLVDFCLILL